MVVISMARSNFLILFIMILFTFGCSEEKEIPAVQKSGAAASGVIVAAGDSLTAGYGVLESESYPDLLQKKLREAGYDYRVVNSGVSGETSSGLVSRLEWILTLNPDIVILETGANDGLRGIDTRLVEENIGKIIWELKQREIVVLLAGMKMVWNLGPLYVQEFNAIYPRLAKQYGVALFPFFLQDVATRADLNQPDGIHPNGDGYRIITDNIFPYVVEAIKKVEK
jgi:acyl-CoA thioesterase-1